MGRVVVKWSACFPSTPTMLVPISLKYATFIALKEEKINEKEAC